jgi:two-component system, response regulator
MTTGAAAADDIVLVEDNPQDAELAMRALRSSGAAPRLRWVRDGAEAMELLVGTDGDLPRLVLLDLKIPKLDGHEVLAQLRRDARTRLLPVVILSSSGEWRDIRRAYEAGANSYVVKPVGYERFRDTLAALGDYWLGINQPLPAAPGTPAPPG